MVFTGLSVFPLTPLHNDRVDEHAFVGLIERLVGSGTGAGVDSITVLGSTGSYAYLSAEERARVAQLAVKHAGSVPVIVGVGALRTSHVLEHVDAAVAAGASGLLLAPMSYQPLRDDDVCELFRTVTAHSELPVIVYDNPGTTHFTFSVDLIGRIAALPNIASIKIPPVSASLTDPVDMEAARDRVAQIHAVIPPEVTVGISGDAAAAAGLLAGCDTWYSVIGGTLPSIAIDLVRAVRGGLESAQSANARLAPLWELFAACGGSLRVTAAIAEHLGLVQPRSLPLPIQGLTAEERQRVHEVVDRLGLW